MGRQQVLGRQEGVPGLHSLSSHRDESRKVVWRTTFQSLPDPSAHPAGKPRGQTEQCGEDTLLEVLRRTDRAAQRQLGTRWMLRCAEGHRVQASGTFQNKSQRISRGRGIAGPARGMGRGELVGAVFPHRQVAVPTSGAPECTLLGNRVFAGRTSLG